MRLFFVALCLVISSCGALEDPRSEREAPPKYIVSVSANLKDPACGCEPQSKWKLYNNHPRFSKQVTLRRVVTDRDSGFVVSESIDQYIIEPEFESLLSCKYVESSKPCDSSVAYQKIDEKVLGRNELIADNSYCESACSDINNPFCYQVPVQSKPLLEPLFKFLDNPSPTLPGLLDELGSDISLSACQREQKISFDYEEGVISNSSSLAGKSCLFSSRASVFDVSMASHVEAKAIKATAVSPKNFLSFRNNYSSFKISFDDEEILSDSDFGVESYEALYGGYVRNVSEMNGEMIVETSNGCLRAKRGDT
ncbi:hypothetical protein [Microbulbifer celer]|uniref:Uncharacterized protein n=1 Tax=Microbulbifer celer TaxID=435905 RepID=A0ABW3UDN9_9GAMM|nr:hypothetical protein [Microbulbifer celer]UFN58898.1 hypothetical protein LPW13_07620 [Microbulbifer celer]